MRVTPEMTTEGGQALSKMADFLDVNKDGVQVVLVAGVGCVRLTVDSTSYPSKSAWMDADTADALGDLLKLRAAELRARA